MDKATLEKIAHLSRLHVDKNQEKDLLKSLNDILAWMDQLREVDTKNVDPLTHMTRETNIMREDEAGNLLDRKIALENAPKHDGQFFRVPRVKKKH